jgi:hypothetical protein
MKRQMKLAALAVLTLTTATACPRRVEVESEPNRFEAAPAQIEMSGAYDYVVEFDSGETTSGPMTVRRSGDTYAVDIVSEMGEVTTSNVRRTGNTLAMDTHTPGGAGTIQLTWESADLVTGSVFIGETIRLRATRQQ